MNDISGGLTPVWFDYMQMKIKYLLCGVAFDMVLEIFLYCRVSGHSSMIIFQRVHLFWCFLSQVLVLIWGALPVFLSLLYHLSFFYR